MKNNSNQKQSSRSKAPALAAVLCTVSLAGVSAAETTPPSTIRETVSNREVVMPVEGMSCVACVARVKKEISAMPGVAAVNVDLAERRARISFDPKRISPKELAAAIDKLGYKAGEPKEAPQQK